MPLLAWPVKPSHSNHHVRELEKRENRYFYFLSPPGHTLTAVVSTPPWVRSATAPGLTPFKTLRAKDNNILLLRGSRCLITPSSFPYTRYTSKQSLLEILLQLFKEQHCSLPGSCQKYHSISFLDKKDNTWVLKN